MWFSLLMTFARAEELVEPGVALTGPVQAEGRTFTSAQPMYLLPTTTFDKMLETTVKFPVCRDGLAEAKRNAVLFEREVGATLDEAKSALVACSIQSLDLQERLAKAKNQRNLAIGAASILLVGGVIGLSASM